MYDAWTNWNDLEKFKLNGIGYTLPMVFETLSATIVSETGFERPEPGGPEVIKFHSDESSLSNKSVISITADEAVLERLMTRKRSHTESDVLSLKKISPG